MTTPDLKLDELHLLSTAEEAYRAYAAATGGKTWDGRDMPTWEQLPEKIQHAWEVAAGRVEHIANQRVLELFGGPEASILLNIARERRRQDRKWGRQDHPIIDPLDRLNSRTGYQGAADDWKAENDLRNNPDSQFTLAWDGILLEEVYEALAEEDPEKVIEELTQTAAVVVAMIASVKRNGLTGSAG